jgi:hypothetical protein
MNRESENFKAKHEESLNLCSTVSGVMASGGISTFRMTGALKVLSKSDCRARPASCLGSGLGGLGRLSMFHRQRSGEGNEMMNLSRTMNTKEQSL